MRLNYIKLEGFTVEFSQAAKDSELIKEIQLSLRNAGCQIPEVDGLWSANLVAGLAVFCAVHEIVACGLTPTLAHELLEYGDG